MSSHCTCTSGTYIMAVPIYHTLPSCSVTDRPGQASFGAFVGLLFGVGWPGHDLDDDHVDDDILAVVRK